MKRTSDNLAGIVSPVEIKHFALTHTHAAKAKIGRQTMEMAFEYKDHTADTIYFNVWLSLYTKRSAMTPNEDAKAITGENPLASITTALKMFDELEKATTAYYCHQKFDVVIYCSWISTERKKAYWHFLKKRGYHFGRIDGHEVIMKKFPRVDAPFTDDEIEARGSIVVVYSD